MSSKRTGRFENVSIGCTVFFFRSLVNVSIYFLDRSVSDKRTLKYYNHLDTIFLITDAGPNGLGAVLAQKEMDEIRSVLCISRSLTPCEVKYCQTEKECLGIIWAMEKLYIYLYGIKFILITDCKPLFYLFERVRSKPSSKISILKHDMNQERRISRIFFRDSVHLRIP